MTAPVDGQLYIKTDVTPFQLYIFLNNQWNIVGVPAGIPANSFTNVALASTVTADSTNGAGYEAANAINGDVINLVQWVSGGSNPPHWIQLDFPVATRVYIWKCFFQGSPWPARDFKLQSWNSTTNAWIDIDTVTGNVDASISRSVPFFDTSRVRLWVTVPSQNGDTRVRLIEIELYGFSLGL